MNVGRYAPERLSDKMFVTAEALRTCLNDYIFQRSSLQMTWKDCTTSGLTHWNWHLRRKPVNIHYSSGRRTEKYSSTFSWRKQNLCIQSKMINMSFGIPSSTFKFSLHYAKRNIHPLLKPIISSLSLIFFFSSFCFVEIAKWDDEKHKEAFDVSAYE